MCQEYCGCLATSNFFFLQVQGALKIKKSKPKKEKAPKTKDKAPEEVEEVVEKEEAPKEAEEPTKEEKVEEVVEEVTEEVKEEKVEEVKEDILTVPSGPRNLVAIDVTAESVTLKWEEPENNGGCEILSYVIVMREVEKTKYKKTGQVDGVTLTLVTDKVKAGLEYSFRVYAENKIGMSEEYAETEMTIKIPKKKKTKVGVKSEVTTEESVTEESSIEVSMSQKTEESEEVTAEMTISAEVKTEQEAAPEEPKPETVEEAVHEEPVKEEAVPEEPVKVEAVPEELVKEEAAPEPKEEKEVIIAGISGELKNYKLHPSCLNQKQTRQFM